MDTGADEHQESIHRACISSLRNLHNIHVVFRCRQRPIAHFVHAAAAIDTKGPLGRHGPPMERGCNERLRESL